MKNGIPEQCYYDLLEWKDTTDLSSRTILRECFNKGSINDLTVPQLNALYWIAFLKPMSTK